MKKYRIRKGSLLDNALPFLVVLAVVIMAGIGNHFVDGIY